jgi:hypothetical protein
MTTQERAGYLRSTVDINVTSQTNPLLKHFHLDSITHCHEPCRDLAAQRRIFPEAPDVAYYKCFLEVVQGMRNLAVNNGVTVRFTFDLRRESRYNATLLYDVMARRRCPNGTVFCPASRLNHRKGMCAFRWPISSHVKS